MYSKILAELGKKFPGLPKSLLGLLAKQLEAKVTEESQIEGAIAELDQQISIRTLGDEFQREGDRRVTSARQEWESKNPKPTDNNNPKPTESGNQSAQNQNDPPEWAKSLINEVKELRKEKTIATVKQRLAEKLKDIPQFIWAKRVMPEKEEDLEAFINEVTTDWNDFKTEQINQGLMKAPKPEGGGAGSGSAGSDKALEAEIEGWAKQHSSDNK